MLPLQWSLFSFYILNHDLHSFARRRPISRGNVPLISSGIFSGFNKDGWSSLMSLQIKHSLQKLQERVVKKNYQVQIRAGSICSLIWPAYSTLETTGINEHQSLHMSPISLARCFTLLCKGLSPGETAVKIKFQEEDKKIRSLWGNQQP